MGDGKVPNLVEGGLDRIRPQLAEAVAEVQPVARFVHPDQSIPENYRNTWAYSVGFDYMVTPKWTVRGGVQRDLSPVTAGNRDPRIPDGNRWNFAAGTSYALTPHMTMDLAASYDKIKSEPIDKTEAAYVGTPLRRSSRTTALCTMPAL